MQNLLFKCFRVAICLCCYLFAVETDAVIDTDPVPYLKLIEAETASSVTLTPSALLLDPIDKSQDRTHLPDSKVLSLLLKSKNHLTLAKDCDYTVKKGDLSWYITKFGHKLFTKDTSYTSADTMLFKGALGHLASAGMFATNLTFILYSNLQIKDFPIAFGLIAGGYFSYMILMDLSEYALTFTGQKFTKANKLLMQILLKQDRFAILDYLKPSDTLLYQGEPCSVQDLASMQSFNQEYLGILKHGKELGLNNVLLSPGIKSFSLLQLRKTKSVEHLYQVRDWYGIHRTVNDRTCIKCMGSLRASWALAKDNKGSGLCISLAYGVSGLTCFNFGFLTLSYFDSFSHKHFADHGFNHIKEYCNPRMQGLYRRAPHMEFNEADYVVHKNAPKCAFWLNFANKNLKGKDIIDFIQVAMQAPYRYPALPVNSVGASILDIRNNQIDEYNDLYTLASMTKANIILADGNRLGSRHSCASFSPSKNSKLPFVYGVSMRQNFHMDHAMTNLYNWICTFEVFEHFPNLSYLDISDNAFLSLTHPSLIGTYIDNLKNLKQLNMANSAIFDPANVSYIYNFLTPIKNKLFVLDVSSEKKVNASVAQGAKAISSWLQRQDKLVDLHVDFKVKDLLPYDMLAIESRHAKLKATLANRQFLPFNTSISKRADLQMYQLIKSISDLDTYSYKGYDAKILDYRTLFPDACKMNMVHTSMLTLATLALVGVHGFSYKFIFFTGAFLYVLAFMGAF